jgi:hypothetical protein
MNTYSIWNNDLGERQVWTNDDQTFTQNFDKDQYNEYLQYLQHLENSGYRSAELETAE